MKDFLQGKRPPVRRYASHLIHGRAAENHARRHLEREGLVFVEANYRCRAGEIDLIMRQEGTIVFVEVRYRKGQSYGGALESIDSGKQRRLRAAAEHYLQRRRSAADSPCRFDVVLITGSPRQMEWIPNAL